MHLEVLQWALALGCDWDYRTCKKAARNGHLEVLQWAQANGCPKDIIKFQKSIRPHTRPSKCTNTIKKLQAIRPDRVLVEVR